MRVTDYGIKQHFQTYVGFCHAGVLSHYRIPGQGRFGIHYRAIVRCLGLPGECQFLRNFLDALVKNNFTFIQNYDGVNQVFHITHLVSGDNKASFFVNGIGHYFAKLTFRWDVESVSRFIEN